MLVLARHCVSSNDSSVTVYPMKNKMNKSDIQSSLKVQKILSHPKYLTMGLLWINKVIGEGNRLVSLYWHSALYPLE